MVACVCVCVCACVCVCVRVCVCVCVCVCVEEQVWHAIHSHAAMLKITSPLVALPSIMRACAE